MKENSCDERIKTFTAEARQESLRTSRSGISISYDFPAFPSIGLIESDDEPCRADILNDLEVGLGPAGNKCQMIALIDTQLQEGCGLSSCRSFQEPFAR